MNELVIKPTFSIGDKAWICGMYSCDKDEEIEIEDITIDHDKKCFLYHYSFGRWFYDSNVGTSVFKTTDDLERFLKTT